MLCPHPCKHCLVHVLQRTSSLCRAWFLHPQCKHCLVHVIQRFGGLGLVALPPSVQTLFGACASTHILGGAWLLHPRCKHCVVHALQRTSSLCGLGWPSWVGWAWLLCPSVQSLFGGCASTYIYTRAVPPQLFWSAFAEREGWEKSGHGAALASGL